MTLVYQVGVEGTTGLRVVDSGGGNGCAGDRRLGQSERQRNTPQIIRYELGNSERQEQACRNRQARPEQLP
ncbi:hypothetical protein EVAR_39403_1 [Eumeta japonica]|uniref:Uncharacterized protein n=1 Tax=Eumeta variegata TaxID=151549 RepID=A0A4C1Z022_EUMVA|nr:hypothetical protein EVAR_39403_1 [Eumeta japonica]